MVPRYPIRYERWSEVRRQASGIYLVVRYPRLIATRGSAKSQPTPGCDRTDRVRPFPSQRGAASPPWSQHCRGVAGEPCFVSALVKSAQGKPIAGATVDVWQAGADGFYDVQHPEWQEMKLRAVFKTDAEGRFRLRTIKPCSYPVPTDGPVGDMLRALHQNPYRPAHLHCMIRAEGYDRLITHVFVEGDPYLDADAVFGVRSSCIGDYVRHEPGVAPDGTRLEVPFHTLDYEFVLQALAYKVRRNSPRQTGGAMAMHSVVVSDGV